MPVDLADALYEHLLDRFPADHDYPRGALYVEGMPPLVADLLGRTLDRWLEHELDSLESRWFDFDDPGVRAARAELVVALGRTARVPRGAWAETLRYAVGLVVRHLATPARALTDATFEGQSEPLPTEMVRSRLFTFKANAYLPKIADAYLGQKKLESLDPDTLHGLLLRIDRRVTSGYGPEEWQRLLGPLFKLARTVPNLKGVPAPLLEQFFAAKGKHEVASVLGERGAATLDEAALHKILNDILGATPAAAAPEAVDESAAETLAGEVLDEEKASETATKEPETPADEAVDAGPSDDQREVDSEAAEHDDELEEDVARGDAAARFSDSPAVMPGPPAEPEPLWKRFAEGLKGPTLDTAVPQEAPSVVTEAPAPSSTSPAHSPDQGADTATGDRPLWKKFFPARGEPEASGREADAPRPEPPETSLDELEKRVLGRRSARQRRRYVAELFAGDEAAYETALRTLDACDSWSEAAQVIAREIFRKHGVDIYSDAAVDFTDTVNANFDG